MTHKFHSRLHVTIMSMRADIRVENIPAEKISMDVPEINM